MRIPLSFHSTEARPRPATASATLSAVGAQHRQNRPEDLEPDVPAALLSRRHRNRGGAWEIAREHHRAPEDLAGNPGALEIASSIRPASAPCLSTPVMNERSSLTCRLC
jgi:hypothetical protein